MTNLKNKLDMILSETQSTARAMCAMMSEAENLRAECTIDGDCENEFTSKQYDNLIGEAMRLQKHLTLKLREAELIVRPIYKVPARNAYQ